MKGSSLLAAVLLCVSLRTSAAEPAAPGVTLDPPPGWSDITAKTPVDGVVLALRGPETSSLAVARMPSSALDSAAATRAYLTRALDGVRTGARLDYRSNGRVETKTFRNGVTAHFLRATVDGQPRLIVAVLEAGGTPLLGTLASAAPDAMMGPLFGAMSVGAPAPMRDSGSAQSTDGQLKLALGGGLRTRGLTGDERKQGVVLVVQGAGSEVVFLKVEDEDAAPKDQAAIVRATAADAAKVPLESVSPARRAVTPAGPAAVYAWTKLSGSPDLRFAAGFLPWQYWGYSVLARGPQADELLIGVLAALKQGPSAVPGLVAASPAIEVPGEAGRRALPLGAAAAGAAAVLFLVWSRGRKNANLPP
jgi:hypothetical protein